MHPGSSGRGRNPGDGMTRDKTYLGDGCYVSFDGFSLWLTTEDGISVQNTVCLEPQVYRALLRYATECGVTE